jgi:hypothetical protein
MNSVAQSMCHSFSQAEDENHSEIQKSFMATIEAHCIDSAALILHSLLTYEKNYILSPLQNATTRSRLQQVGRMNEPMEIIFFVF